MVPFKNPHPKLHFDCSKARRCTQHRLFYVLVVGYRSNPSQRLIASKLIFILKIVLMTRSAVWSSTWSRSSRACFNPSQNSLLQEADWKPGEVGQDPGWDHTYFQSCEDFSFGEAGWWQAPCSEPCRVSPQPRICQRSLCWPCVWLGGPLEEQRVIMTHMQDDKFEWHL